MIQIVTPQQDLPQPDPLATVQVSAPAVAPGRLKLPAYGKQLLLHRTGGFHPRTVRLAYGDDWRFASETKKREEAARAAGLDPYCREWIRRCGPPTLALRPREYQPGAIDWRLVVAAQIEIDDQRDALWDADGRLMVLLGEVARWSADIAVRGSYGQRGADELAFCCRGRLEGGGWGWPAWWSDEIQGIHERRSRQWFKDAIAIDDACSV